MTPYTYLIGWTKLGKYYYGVRYSSHCDPSDLWTTYYTSSRHVKSFRIQHGEPDIIQVRKTFPNRHTAIKHEEKVLRRLDCAGRDDFLNKANGKAIPVELSTKSGSENGMYGRSHSEETKAKMRKKHKMPSNISEIASVRASKKFGTKNAMFKGYIHTPKGMFETLAQASEAEGVTVGQINYWLKNERPKYNGYYRVRA